MLQFVLWLPDGSLCHPGVPKQPAGASPVVGTLGAAVDMNDSCLRTSWSAFFLPRAGLFRLQSLTGCTQMLQSEHHPSLTKLLGTPSSNGLQQCVLLQRGITGWTQFLQTESCEHEALGQAAVATGVSAGCRQGTWAVPCHSNGAAELWVLLSVLRSAETCWLGRGLAKWYNTALPVSTWNTLVTWFVEWVIFKVL